MKFLISHGTMVFGVTLFAVAAFSGCEQKSAPKNSQPASPEPESHVTAEDVQRETEEAANATKEYLGEKKDEFVAEMNKKLEDLDTKIAEMKVEGAKLQGEAKEKWDASMEDLKVKRAEMSTKLEELKKSSGSAWEELKSGLKKAADEVDSAANNAVEKFKEKNQEEKPDTNPKP